MEQIHDRNYARRWSTVIAKARQNVEYVRAFKAYLENPVSFDPELKAIKDQADVERSYEELKALRELAVWYLKKERWDREEQGAGMHDAAVYLARSRTSSSFTSVVLRSPSKKSSLVESSPPETASFFVEDSSPEDDNKQPPSEAEGQDQQSSPKKESAASVSLLQHYFPLWYASGGEPGTPSGTEEATEATESSTSFSYSIPPVFF